MDDETTHPGRIKRTCDAILGNGRVDARPCSGVRVTSPSHGYEDVLSEAKQKSKVVVLEDMRTDLDSGLFATFVGPDMVAEGRKAADAMCTLLSGSSKKRVAEIAGTLTSSAAVDRAQGFRDGMASCGITIARSETAKWDAASARNAMTDILDGDRDIQGVFAHNDLEAIGAIEAVEEAGLVPGKDVKVVGVDANAEGFQYLISGKLGADIECSPMLAPQVFDAALKALNGERLPAWIPSNEGAFYASQGPDALRKILDEWAY